MSANTQSLGSNVVINVAEPDSYDLRTRKVERSAPKRSDLKLTRNDDGTLNNWRPKNPPRQWRLKANPPELQKIYKRRRGKILAAKEWRRRCELHATANEQLVEKVNALSHSWVIGMEKYNGAWEHGVRVGELDAWREEREMFAQERLRIHTVLGGKEMIESAAYAELEKHLAEEEKYSDKMEVVVEIAETKASIAETKAGIAEDEAQSLHGDVKKLGEIAAMKATVADLRIKLLEAKVARLSSETTRLSEQLAAQALLELAS